MGWNKNKGWPKQSQEWDQSWGRDRKKQEEKEAKGGVVLYDYDGKKIDLSDGGSGLRSTSSSSKEVQLQTENRKLKEAFRKLMDPKSAEKDVPEEVQKILETNPREELKEKQRLLNEERKALNKVEKLKDAMRKKEEKYTSWKEGITVGLQKAAEKHGNVMAELNTALRDAEKGEDGQPEILSDDDAQEADTQADLRSLKQQVNGFMAYAQMMDQRHQELTSQMSAMMQMMQGGFSLPVSSPQHPLRRGNKRGAETSPEGSERNRSRSPMRAVGKVGMVHRAGF